MSATKNVTGGENKMTVIYGNARCGANVGRKEEKVRSTCPSEGVSRLQWHPLGLQWNCLVSPSAQSLPRDNLHREKVRRDRIGDRVKGCNQEWVHGA